MHDQKKNKAQIVSKNMFTNIVQSVFFFTTYQLIRLWKYEGFNNSGSAVLKLYYNKLANIKQFQKLQISSVIILFQKIYNPVKKWTLNRCYTNRVILHEHLIKWWKYNWLYLYYELKFVEHWTLFFITMTFLWLIFLNF